MKPGELLALAKETERQWVLKRNHPADRRQLPWMPSDIAQWLVLLIEAMAAQHGTRYLEIGCGPGGKLLIARDLLGLEVTGFDTDRQTVAAAQQLLGRPGTPSGSVVEADALDWDYGPYDVIFFNRPFRDRALEAELETLVWRETRRGAAVVVMNLESPPPGWLPVADDWEARRGVWLKP